MIDSHCHLHYDYTPKTTAELLAEAHSAGVEAFVTVGVDLETLDQVQTLAEQHPSVWFTAGVHPHDAEKLAASSEGIDLLEKAAAHPKCVAIGEIGLDYYYEHSDRDVQKLQLQRQLDLALRVKKPIVVHSRDAESDLLPLLTDYAKQAVSAGRPPGVIHCFTGTLAFGQACIDSGFYISFSGILTFKNAADLRECAQAFPLERILVETDSPYLAPVPYRGKKCEPAMVMATAKFLADLKGVSLAELDQATTSNTRRVFSLSIR